MLSFEAEIGNWNKVFDRLKCPTNPKKFCLLSFWFSLHCPEEKRNLFYRNKDFKKKPTLRVKFDIFFTRFNQKHKKIFRFPTFKFYRELSFLCFFTRSIFEKKMRKRTFHDKKTRLDE